MNEITLPKPELTGDEYFDLEAARDAIAAGAPVRFPPFEVVHLPEEGLSFCLNMQRDPVQNSLRKGRFFEQKELGVLSSRIQDAAYVIDVGANIGNHAIYFATRMRARRVIVIEPNPLALAPLVANILVNRLTGIIDMSALGVGLADKSESGFGMSRHDRNLGATRMFPGRGEMEVHAGDDLFDDAPPDLIKIDVEGMEMKVLSGFERIISSHRPMILIEVDDSHKDTFEKWRQSHGYEVIFERRHSERNCNFILRHKTKAAAL